MHPANGKNFKDGKKSGGNITNSVMNSLPLTPIYLGILFIYMELVLHFACFGGIGVRIVYPMLYSLLTAGIVFFISGIVPPKAGRIVILCFVSLLSIYYETQLIYRGVFGSFMPIAQVALGANAVSNFIFQIFYCIGRNIIPFILLLIPIPLTFVLVLRHKLPVLRLEKKQALITAGSCLGCFALTMGIMLAFSGGKASAFNILVGSNTATDTSVKNVGLIATTVQELGYNLFGSDGKSQTYIDGEITDGFDMPDSADEKYNIDNSIDFEALADSTDDEKLLALNSYLSSLEPTSKNEYTGSLKDYNLVMICAESFSPYVIDEELTPTLYKMSNGGYVFENFYCSFPNTTTAGEYAFNTGLMPDMYRSKIASSFDASSTNYLPYCMGNVFSGKGYPAYAYHNYYGTFYNRNLSHENMGYVFKAAEYGLDIKISWPSSDLEMIDVSAPDFINSESPFCAYYMTFSGHYQYNWNNAMSAKNKDAVSDLDYTEEVKAYLACNLELEYALASLEKQLDAAGQLENTVFVLTADHYPYGLTEGEYNNLAGADVDTVFEKYRSSFICYVPGMEPVVVPDYCSTIDILPTLLNLFGVNYDSRLLAGKDVLSDARHVAVLSDRSYITDTFRYDAATDTAISVDGTEVAEETIQEYSAYVGSLFDLSVSILDLDYYAHIYKTAKPGDDSDDYVNVFSDVTNVYYNASSVYVSEHGYMVSDSETVFGGTRNETIGEFIDSIYRVEGAPAVIDDPALPKETLYRDAVLWGTANGLLDRSDNTDENISFKQTAVIIYRYKNPDGENADIDPYEISGLLNMFPGLTREEIIAMNWCDQTGIIQSTSQLYVQEMGGDFITRFQGATYLTRMCTYTFS